MVELGLPPGSPIVSKVVGRNQSGQLEVFAVNSTGQVVHIAQTSPNNGWGTWTSLGRPTLNDSVGGLAVGMNADGRQEVLANGSFALWDIWQTSPSNGWSGWDYHD